MTSQGNFKNTNKILQKLNALKASTLRLLMLLDSLAYNPKYPNQCWYGATKLIKMLNTSETTFYNDRFILEYAGLIIVSSLDKDFYSKNGKKLYRPKDQNHYTINRDYIYHADVKFLNEKITSAIEKRKQKIPNKNNKGNRVRIEEINNYLSTI